MEELSLADTEIILTAKSFVFDKATGTYSIKLTDATLISHDVNKKTITFKLSPKRIHKSCQTIQINDIKTLDERQMSYLLDEIEMDNDQQIRRESTESSHHTLLSDLISEWNSHSNPSAQIRCNGRHKCNECKASKRIHFILRYYTEWLQIKFSSKQPDEDIPPLSPMLTSTPFPSKKCSQIMGSFHWISDFFFELTNYSTYDLYNDFQHILKYHILSGVKQKSGTHSYFTSLLGTCDDTLCPCYLRTQRDINIDNKMENRRKANFFIIDDDELAKQNSKTAQFKINKEINLQQMLDSIHVSLLHEKQKRNVSNSFKYMSRISRNRMLSTSSNAYAKSDNKEDIRLGKYTFGSSITYWDNKHHRYCKPKHMDLQSELLKNSVYALSTEMYESLKSKAIHFLNTNAGKELIAQREHDWMKQFKIPCGSQMSVDHVMVLLCYCNIPCLQRAYKRYGYQREGRTRVDLLRHHSQIWHYSRLLLESIHCYGLPLHKKKKYYHGIDTLLIFDRYNLMIDIPVSVTTAKDIGYGFSDIDGITVEFGHGGLSDLQSLCLDLSVFSNHPIEEEYLIFHTFVSIKDICIKRLHHEQWLSILRFWHRVNEGFFQQHLIENEVVSRNDQLCICAMIQNMMIDSQHKKYDHRIPKYMQKLFNVLGGNSFFWIIKSEYECLIPKLKRYLMEDNSPFIQYLKKSQVTVRSAQVFTWKINAIDTNRLFVDNHPWIKSSSYKVYMNDKKEYLLFHFECQNKAKSGLFRCRIHLDERPKHVSRVSFGNGLFCHELIFDNYSYGELTEKRLYNMSLHSLFETRLLKQFQTGFTLTLQIQIFEIKNRNGDSISINPHQ